MRLRSILCGAWLALVASCAPMHPAFADGVSPAAPFRATPFDPTSSQNITGLWTFPTQAPLDDSTKAANTAYVDAAIAALAVTPDLVGDTDYSIPFVDQLVAIDVAWTSPHTLTLPAASLYRAGAPLEIDDWFGAINATDSMTLRHTGSDSICLASCASSFTFKTTYAKIVLISDGSSHWNTGILPAHLGGTGSGVGPTTGQVLVGTGNATYAPQTISGDATLSSAGVIAVTGGTHLAGVTDGSSACTGCVGEVISSKILSGAAVSLTTATTANLTSLALTAGDWEVFGALAFTGTATAVTFCGGGFNATTATLPTLPDYMAWLGRGGAFTVDVDFPVPKQIENTSSPVTYYLTARCTFTGGTALVYGEAYAVRYR